MAFDWLQQLWKQEGSASSAVTAPLATSTRGRGLEDKADQKEFQSWQIKTTELQSSLITGSTATRDHSPKAEFALPLKDGSGLSNQIQAKGAISRQDATSTALAASLTNPIWNPETPTGSQWISWLDGLGKLSVPNNGQVNVGIYTGPTTSHARVRVSAVSAQLLANSRQIFYEMDQFLGTSFNVEPITSISATNSSHPLRLFSGKISGYAYAYGPGTGSLNSDMFFNINYDKTGINSNFFRNGYGSHGWQTIWHETGHALGLNHTFESGTPIQFDNWNYSSMTYTFVGGEATSWGVGDLAYLQYLYGAQTNYLSGDQVYNFSDIDSFTNYYSTGGPGAPTFSDYTNAVLYDAGGTDTCDFSALSKGIRYDFDNITGTSSVCYVDEFLITPYEINNTTQYMTGSQTAIAYGTIIEKVIGTAYTDQFLTTLTRSEYVDGGGGTDYVYLPGQANDYSIQLQGDTTLVSALQSPLIQDVFKGIEYFVFDSPSVYQASDSYFILA